MTDLSKERLAELRERVEKASGPDRDLDRDICIYLDREAAEPDGSAGWKRAPAYTASIDAALALVERVLPGWGKEITLPAGDAYGACRLFPGDERNAALMTFGKTTTAPLAILSALLSALTQDTP